MPPVAARLSSKPSAAPTRMERYSLVVSTRNFVTKKTTVLVAAHSEDFVIPVCTVLIELQSVTDGQTDGRLGHG